MQGQIHEISIESQVISKGNTYCYAKPRAFVFAPSDVVSQKDLPVLYVLAPWLSAGRALVQWKPFRESFPERLERLWQEKKIPKCIAVFPDLFTPYGGSQYINSSFFGGHGDFIVKELIPAVEKQFPVSAERYVLGRSSGGFGALRFVMDYPGYFKGAACHSGDMGFEQMIHGDLTTLPRGLARYDEDIGKFLDYCQKAKKLSNLDTHLLMLLGSCGFYSPDQNAPFGFQLPVDLHTGETKQDVWKTWLQHDPVVRLDSNVENMARVDKLYIECGLRDQYRLLYGARQLHNKLERHQITHRYEEFDDNHSATDYRFDVSLPFLLS